MNAVIAAERLSSALERWEKSKATVKGGWRTDADLRDRDRRLMELDEAIAVADRFRGFPAVDLGLALAHKAMMGDAA